MFDSFPLIIVASFVGVGLLYGNDTKHHLTPFLLKGGMRVINLQNLPASPASLSIIRW
jgi:hypothetical protein